jgi:hypothetical protein
MSLFTSLKQLYIYDSYNDVGAHIMQQQMSGLLVNYELESMRKEAAGSKLKYYPGILQNRQENHEN